MASAGLPPPFPRPAGAASSPGGLSAEEEDSSPLEVVASEETSFSEATLLFPLPPRGALVRTCFRGVTFARILLPPSPRRGFGGEVGTSGVATPLPRPPLSGSRSLAKTAPVQTWLAEKSRNSNAPPFPGQGKRRSSKTRGSWKSFAYPMAVALSSQRPQNKNQACGGPRAHAAAAPPPADARATSPPPTPYPTRKRQSPPPTPAPPPEPLAPQNPTQWSSL